MNEALWARLQRSETALDGVTSDAEDAVLQLQAALQQAAQRQAAQRQAQGQHEQEVGGEEGRPLGGGGGGLGGERGSAVAGSLASNAAWSRSLRHLAPVWHLQVGREGGRQEVSEWSCQLGSTGGLLAEDMCGQLVYRGHLKVACP